MKHTTTRKKMLLSSVAMLLVAMLALGSATFAWFTANPKAEAKGLSLKTTASAGLVVRTDSDYVWDHNAVLYNGQTNPFNLVPVSQDQTKPNDIWTIDAKKSDNYAALDGATDKMTTASWAKPTTANNTTPSTFSSGAAYSEKVYFRLSDGSNAADASGKKVNLTGVTITAAEGASMQNAIRVAIANKSGELIGTYALSTAKSHGTLTGAADNEDTSEVDETGTPTAGSYSPALAVATDNLNKECPTTNLTAADTLNNYVTVYVYLDGQHEDCNSDMVGTANAAKIISDITLNFELM